MRAIGICTMCGYGDDEGGCVVGGDGFGSGGGGGDGVGVGVGVGGGGQESTH